METRPNGLLWLSMVIVGLSCVSRVSGSSDRKIYYWCIKTEMASDG